MKPEKYNASNVLNHNAQGINQQLVAVTNRVARAAGEKGLNRQLRRGACIRDVTDLATYVSINFKTHKALGDVSVRVLHICQAHPYREIGKWVSSMLRPQLETSCPHIMKDTAQLIGPLRKVCSRDRDLLVKANVHDFYMSVAQAAGSFVVPHLPRPVTDVVLHVLSQQFVRSEDENEVISVRIGAGMGLNMAGDIADALFVRQNEHPVVLKMCNPKISHQAVCPNKRRLVFHFRPQPPRRNIRLSQRLECNLPIFTVFDRQVGGISVVGSSRRPRSLQNPRRKHIEIQAVHKTIEQRHRTFAIKRTPFFNRKNMAAHFGRQQIGKKFISQPILLRSERKFH